MTCSHIVFLIDEHQLCYSENIVAQIHLACLRILSYYSSRMSTSSIFWGYKFYNSLKSHSKEYKQRVFLDYTIEKFNAFEQRLYKKVNVETLGEPNIKPGVLLKVALSEILTEFHWDQPELLSPCKLLTSSSNHSDNMVFLITRYPSQDYFNETVKDKKSFFNALFPPMLFEKFVKQSKIKLYWINSESSVEKSCFFEDHVEGGLKLAKGCLIQLHTITMLWQNDWQHVDLISRDSLLQGLLNPTKSKHQSQKQLYSLKIFCSGESKVESSVSLCCINKMVSEFFDFCNQVYVETTVPKCNISPNAVLQYAYMFFSSPNQEISHHLEKVLLSKEALVIVFKSINGDRRGVMVPYTNCTGAVILLKDNSLEENGTRELFPLSPTFINTSIVNCVDTWFLSNPYLGLPSKEVLISISNNFISKRIEREENSRELVTQLKSKLRSKSSSSESRSSKHQRMQGMSWTRWRLMELNAKKKVKKSIPDETYNTETENHITACRRLEFAFEEDLQKFVEQKYMELLNGVDLNHSGINHLIASIANFYQDNSQNSFDNSVVLSKIIEDVQTIREKWKDSPKANIIHNVLLQVHLLLECVAHGIKCKDYVKMIVFFLRFLTFEESTVFVRDHLNKVIMPKFKSLILETIQEVYEDLMIEPPSEFGDVDDVSPVNSVMLSPSSISNYSNSSSIPSLCSEKKLVKRFPSTAGDCTKKVIAVHSKSTKKKKKIDEDPKVKRNLFEKKTISTPRRNKMRDKSCVPDTPEAKQINDLIWKKQDRDRRHSQVDKSMAPIEESPLKQKSSPLKCVRKLHRSNSFNVRSSPRKFYKLQRHPTMMIGVNRLNQNQKTPTKSYFEDRSVNCVKHPFSSSKKSKSTPESEIKRRRKSLLFSNFTDVKEAKTHSESEVLLSREGSISAVEEREACGSTRRNIFARRILSDASDINSIPCSGDFPSRRIFSDTSDINSIPCSGGFPSRRILSDASDINSIPCSGGFPSRRIFSDTSDPSLSFSSIIDQSECFETNEDGHKSGSLKRKQSTTYLDRKKICRSPHNDNFNNFCDENAIFFTKYKDVDETFHSLTLKQNGKKVSKNPLHVLTETTVDWLEKIETDEVATPRSLTFQEAFAKLTPEQCKSSPTLVKAGDDIITVSPCLSASSIQCLEKAPIISPYRPNIKSKKRGRFAGQP